MRPVVERRAAGSTLVVFAILLGATGEALHGQDAAPSDNRIWIVRPRRDPAIMEYRRGLQEAKPALRGFRAPILDNASKPWPIDLPAFGLPPNAARAAEIVARRLAFDGLLPTVAAALEALGPANVGPAEGAIEQLKAIGVPVDLLEFFPMEDSRPRPSSGAGEGAEPTAVRTVRHVCSRLIAGATAAGLKDELSAVPFVFRKTRADFRAITESGEDEIGMLRLQVTRGDYWAGPGDGCSVDIARQLIEKLPDVDLVISIEERFLDSFLSLARTWPIRRKGQVTVIAEPLTVAQWAQDNGKPGWVGRREDGSLAVATLAPRYANRGEEGSTFVPGETFVIEGLAALGHLVIQSPLVFQGGDLMCVRDPAGGRTILLAGEAEVYRNTALGLTREQAIEALRLEMGADAVEVLPAVSFHIDYEISVRNVGGRLTALVNDTEAVTMEVLKAALSRLKDRGAFEPERYQLVLDWLEAGGVREAFGMVAEFVRPRAVGLGRFPESFARKLGQGEVDSGVGNLHRFLLAIDHLAHGLLGPGEHPRDPNAAAFVRALQSRNRDRRELIEQISRLGWQVVAIPSWSEGDRSLNYINGVQERRRYLMPAYGGLFEEVDRAATAKLRSVLGPQVEVVPILCGESQRRQGALRCSVGVYPGLN